MRNGSRGKRRPDTVSPRDDTYHPHLAPREVGDDIFAPTPNTTGGSCYGGTPPTDGPNPGCCNTCDEVREAYVRRGWSFVNPDAVEQVRSCVSSHCSSSSARVSLDVGVNHLKIDLRSASRRDGATRSRSRRPRGATLRARFASTRSLAICASRLPAGLMGLPFLLLREGKELTSSPACATHTATSRPAVPSNRTKNTRKSSSRTCKATRVTISAT